MSKKSEPDIDYSVGKYSDVIKQDAWDNNEYVHWIVHIGSGETTSLVGKTVTDAVMEKSWNNHKYAIFDRSTGVRFKETAPDGTEYEWIAYGGGDGLTWGEDEHSWSYVIPQTLATTDGQIIRLSEGWSYVAEYPGILRIPANEGVTFEVENRAYSYVFPATGSTGTMWLTLGGILLIAKKRLSKAAH